jgi:uncharacterized protein
MLRKFFKRWIHASQNLPQTPGFGFLNRLLQDPNLLHLNRHSVSNAFLIGCFICFLPLPFGQIIFVTLLAVWVGANLPISIALIMISNLATYPFIYFFAYHIGATLLQSPPLPSDFAMTWGWFKHSFGQIWLPITLGCFIIGIGSGVLSYCVIQGLWRWQVARKWANRPTKHKKKPASAGPFD